MKSLQQVSRIMALIPVLQQVGAVIAVIAGLLDLINTKHEKSFNSIVSGIVGQSFITDHYSYISANLKAIAYNIGVQKYDQACQLVESTYFQVNERVQNDELKKWYTSMSNKKSLQLLVLYYKANVQIVQIFDQVLKKRKPQQRQKYKTIMTDYLACLNQLKADFLKYRGSLMSIQLQHDQNPVARLLMSAIISDKGQDKALQIKLKDKDKNHYNDLFIGFKDKSLKKAEEDINTIIVL